MSDNECGSKLIRRSFLVKLAFVGFLLILMLSRVSGQNKTSIEDENQLGIIQSEENNPPEVFRIPLNWNPDMNDISEFKDPYFTTLASWTSRIYGLTYNTLVHYDPSTREIQPELAKDWFVSNDSKHWTFILRDDVLFHNEKKFTAYEVKYNFDRLINSSHPAYLPLVNTSRFQDIVPKIGSIEILSSSQITFHLNQSFSTFISWFVHAYILSPDAFDNGQVVRIIGTGPYKLLNSIEDSQWNLERNEGYFEGLPPFKNIIGIYENNFWEGYVEGKIDTFPGDWLPEEYDDELYPSESHSKTFFGTFNFNHEILSDYKVRQAFNLALDRSFIDGVHEINRPASLFENSQYLEDELEIWDYDPETANQILDDLGYKRDENGTRFHLRITSFIYLNDEVQSMFDILGVTYELIDDVDFGEGFRLGSDIDMLFGTYFAYRALDPGEDIVRFVPNGGYNWGDYNNETVSELFRIAAATPVRQEKSYYYNLLAKILHEQAVNIPISHARTYCYIKPDVSKYVTFNYDHRFNFTYITDTGINQGLTLEQLESHSVYYHGISTSFEISEYPIYYRKQDVVIGTTDQSSLNVTISIDDDISDSNSILNHEDIFKYFSIHVNNEVTKYVVNLYHDLKDENSSVKLFLWVEDKGWVEQNLLSSDNKLKYVSTENSGDQVYGLSLSGSLQLPSTEPPSSNPNDRSIKFYGLAFLVAVILISVIAYSSQSRRILTIKGSLMTKLRFYRIFFPNRDVFLKIIVAYFVIISGITISYLSFFHDGGL